MSDKKKETSPGPSRKDMLQYAKALVLFVPCFELKKKMLDQLAEFSTGAPSEAPGIYNEANQHGAEMHLEGLRLIKLLESKGYLPNGSTGKKSDNTLMNETMVMTMINATGQEVLEKLDSVYTDVTDGNPAAKCKLETILFIFAGHGCTRYVLPPTPPSPMTLWLLRLRDSDQPPGGVVGRYMGVLKVDTDALGAEEGAPQFPLSLIGTYGPIVLGVI